MDRWIIATISVPSHTKKVEIARFEFGEPSFWLLSHAWYNVDTHSWVRKHGEDWFIEYWRESESTLEAEG